MLPAHVPLTVEGDVGKRAKTREYHDQHSSLYTLQVQSTEEAV